MNKPDIIVYSMFRSDNSYSSISLRLAKVWAKTHRVFYVNHPYSLFDVSREWSYLRQKERLGKLLTLRVGFEEITGDHRPIVNVIPPPTVPINRLAEGPLYYKAQQMNNRAVLHAIKKTIEKYNIKDYIYFNCFDPFFGGYLPKDEFSPLVDIYDCIDDISQDNYTCKHGIRLEAEAVANADMTVVTSTELFRKYAPTANHIHTMHNAVEISTIQEALYTKFPRPDDMKAAKGRVIGFVGNLDHLRIDYPLLAKVAKAFPNDTLVLVGPINNTEYIEVGLDKLPNIIFTGSKTYDQLPIYMQHMDVTLIPFLVNKLTRSIYPLKINEYLAIGKPVVSTSFSDDIRSFGDVIYLGEDHDAYIRQIHTALVESDDNMVARRIAVAETNTWEARVAEFWHVIEDVIEKKKGVKASEKV